MAEVTWNPHLITGYYKYIFTIFPAVCVWVTYLCSKMVMVADVVAYCSHHMSCSPCRATPYPAHTLVFGWTGADNVRCLHKWMTVAISASIVLCYLTCAYGWRCTWQHVDLSSLGSSHQIEVQHSILIVQCLKYMQCIILSCILLTLWQLLACFFLLARGFQQVSSWQKLLMTAKVLCQNLLKSFASLRGVPWCVRTKCDRWITTTLSLS